MKGDYLWDGTGEPDPEIQKLETVLARFRHQRPAPSFAGLQAPQPRPRFWQLPWFPRLAAVTAAVVVIASVAIVSHKSNPAHVSEPGWDVASLRGSPRIGSTTVVGNGATTRLGIGQTLETDSRSRASIRVEQIGRVEVEPDTRLRLLKTGSGQKRLGLERGTIHARIWAPPGEFVVDTPSAVAVDLGCAYTLHVDDSGNGLLRTTLGWVGFKLDDRESFIPAGAACATRPKIGPGTPYFEDASELFRTSLSRFDFEANAPADRSAALNQVLAQARKRDALTLWHLLPRVSGSERGRVYDRLAALVPPPRDVTREGVLRLDRGMLDLWWNQLGLGNVSWWRIWERSWTGRENRAK